MTRKRLTPEARQAVLLQAAAALADERGFLEVNHAMVAERVQCSTALTFREQHFPSADALREQLSKWLTHDGHKLRYPRAYAEAMLYLHGHGCAVLLADHFTTVAQMELS